MINGVTGVYLLHYITNIEEREHMIEIMKDGTENNRKRVRLNMHIKEKLIFIYQLLYSNFYLSETN